MPPIRFRWSLSEEAWAVAIAICSCLNAPRSATCGFRSRTSLAPRSITSGRAPVRWTSSDDFLMRRTALVGSVSIASLTLGVAVVVSAPAPDTDLIAAVKTGKVVAVRSVLQKHGDANAADRDGTAALNWAVRADDREAAALLIGTGAAVNATNRYGVSPLSLAARNGSASLLNLLIE